MFDLLRRWDMFLVRWRVVVKKRLFGSTMYTHEKDADISFADDWNPLRSIHVSPIISCTTLYCCTCSPEHVPKESWPLGAQSGWCPENSVLLGGSSQSISSWGSPPFISPMNGQLEGEWPQLGDLLAIVCELLSNWDGPQGTVLSQRSLAVSFVCDVVMFDAAFDDRIWIIQY